MNPNALRAAFFADSFHEVNGVALTSRNIDAYARRQGLPFFSCHVGPRTTVSTEGSVTTCELELGPVSFGLESDLHFDVLFLRHRKLLEESLRKFDPQLIHVTGPSHTGILGATMSALLKVPLVASWHTNIHEYGGRRLQQMLDFLPEDWSRGLGNAAERSSLDVTLFFYKRAKVLLAPNAELCRMLEERTGRECYLMPRGVDTELYSPDRRDRADGAFVVGYVGRLSPEKNVRLLARVDEALSRAGLQDFRICVVGGGGEKEWLQQNLPHGEFPGVLRGEPLARAYANFDLFAFPSRTDTYGNVIQEAMASGVPCVVTNEGGPKFLVDAGTDGLVASTDEDFVQAIVTLASDRERTARMGRKAREKALRASWDRVCEVVWQAYAKAIA
jgi:glycosyltransferase involved in cell wall biosynthesis